MKRRTFIAGLGSAAAWPGVARGQQSAVPVIGYLSGSAKDAEQHLLPSFHHGLSEQGFVEGRNVEIIYHWTAARYDELPALAAQLVSRRVAVIFATGTAAAALAAKSATATIPIVFQFGANPVDLGLVASLNRPGGNITGVTILTQELISKRLELLRDTVPAATTIGFLFNPAAPQIEAEMREAENASRSVGVQLASFKAKVPDEIDTAFADIAQQRVDALLMAADTLFAGAQVDRIAALVSHYRIPAISNQREFAVAGGLMAYGASFFDTYRMAGGYVGRILKGEKPGDLPVQQSTKVEFFINLKAAKALGITFPLKLLGRADEVIE
jgi:putative ABC transport system substrate-binding protein